MNQYTYRHTSIPHPKQYISQQQLNTIFERLLVIMQISIKLCKTDNQWKIHRRGPYHHHDVQLANVAEGDRLRLPIPVPIRDQAAPILRHIL